ncbi:MAG: methyltransferase [Eubacteriales bacterium]|nr:methyltransferase [Eubacteriales bacterium]
MEENILRDKNERLDTVNYDIKIIQRNDGLTYGTDALLLAAYVKAEPQARALELGGGSGIVSFLLATRKKVSHIDCCEVQPTYADIIRRNVEINNLSRFVSVTECDVRSLSEHFPNHSFDIVFSNPPYMKKDSGKSNETELKNISRHEIFGGIDDFVGTASDMLRFGGKFYCVYRPDRLEDLMFSMRKHALEPKSMTFVSANSNAKPSMVLVAASAGGKCSMNVTKNLFIYKYGADEMSEDCKYIYDNGNFPDSFRK